MFILSYKGHGPFSHFFDGMFMDAIKRDKKGKADKEVTDNENWTVRV